MLYSKKLKALWGKLFYWHDAYKKLSKMLTLKEKKHPENYLQGGGWVSLPEQKKAKKKKVAPKTVDVLVAGHPKNRAWYAIDVGVFHLLRQYWPPFHRICWDTSSHAWLVSSTSVWGLQDPFHPVRWNAHIRTFGLVWTCMVNPSEPVF